MRHHCMFGYIQVTKKPSNKIESEELLKDRKQTQLTCPSSENLLEKQGDSVGTLGSM